MKKAKKIIQVVGMVGLGAVLPHLITAGLNGLGLGVDLGTVALIFWLSLVAILLVVEMKDNIRNLNFISLLIRERKRENTLVEIQRDTIEDQRKEINQLREQLYREQIKLFDTVVMYDDWILTGKAPIEEGNKHE